jgi:hypothetical protein
MPQSLREELRLKVLEKGAENIWTEGGRAKRRLEKTA